MIAQDPPLSKKRTYGEFITVDSSSDNNDNSTTNTTSNEKKNFKISNEINAVAVKNNTDTATNENNDDAEEVEDEEPDWATIAQHEPANRDVPLFIDARDRREVAETRFAAALDEAHANLKQCSDDLLKTAADLYNVQREKLDAMEVQIKQDFVDNETARSQMQANLEKSASAAQEQFAQLMMRVTQLGKSMGAIGSSAPARHQSNNS